MEGSARVTGANSLQHGDQDGDRGGQDTSHDRGTDDETEHAEDIDDHEREGGKLGHIGLEWGANAQDHKAAPGPILHKLRDEAHVEKEL